MIARIAAVNSRGELVYPMNAYDAGIANLLPKPSSKPPAAGAPAPPLSIDVDQRLFALLGNPLEALTDTTWTNLSSFSGMVESCCSITE